MKKYSIIFLVFILIISCDFFYHDEEGRKEVGMDDFKGIENLKLKGVVYSINDEISGFHGRGIVRVDVIESNIDYYDPRDKQANYFCIIKNRKAEIYDTHVSSFKLGDTILIDAENKLLFYSNDGKLNPASIWIGPPRFFNKIKKKGYQKL